MKTGKIVKISGPLVLAENVEDAKMFDMVKVGAKEAHGQGKMAGSQKCRHRKIRKK